MTALLSRVMQNFYFRGLKLQTASILGLILVEHQAALL